MNNLFKVFIGIILVLFALAFFAFALQNNADVLITVLPGYVYNIPMYLLVLLCLFAGFLSAIIITRFEYIREKCSLSAILSRFKRNKNKSKYISE